MGDRVIQDVNTLAPPSLVTEVSPDPEPSSRILFEVTVMNVRPLHDRLIVQRLDETTERAGAIIIPDSAKEKPQQGKVLAAGVGKVDEDGRRVPLDVKAEDTILFGKYSGQEIEVDGVEYLIMKEDDVLAIQEGRL